MLGLDTQALATRAGHSVVALSRSELDITDAAAVRTAVERARPDVLINCAAYTKVDQAEQDTATAMRVNADGPGIVAAAATQAGAWVVHVSTDYVFAGETRSRPYVESDVTGPRSVYGASKLAGELTVATAAPESHTIVRSSWLFGLGGPCFPATILRAAASRPALTVVDDQTGSPTFTPHLADALLALAVSQDVVGVAHAAAAGETTWFGFASALVAAAREQPDGTEADITWASVAPCSTEDYPLPAPRPAFSVLRSERDGVPALPHWRDGLNEYMAARAARTEGV
jgi:dTDP-4-dehydrorhamnose reductase